MLRVVEIQKNAPYKLVCRFNNGIEKQLDVLPIIENHKHILGVETLLNESVFNEVRIGRFGEILWPKIVKTNQNGQIELWDYDISPEYAYSHST